MATVQNTQNAACPKVKIDREIAELCPRLAVDELLQLADNLKADGCLEPLVAWLEENTLLDGHNRYHICREEGIGYEVRYLSFVDKSAAKKWVIDHQLGRRNLRPDQISLLRGQRYELQKDDQHSHEGTGPKDNSGADLTPESSDARNGRTRDRLAEQYGVSPKTIERDGRFAAAAKVIQSHSSIEVREALSSKKVARTKEEFCDLAASLQGQGSHAPEVAEAALSLVSAGSVKSLREAVERAETAVALAQREAAGLDAEEPPAAKYSPGDPGRLARLADMYQSLTRDLQNVLTKLEKLANNQRDGASWRISWASLKTEARALKTALSQATPVAYCPKCCGCEGADGEDSCGTCFGTGFLTKYAFSQLSAADQASIREDQRAAGAEVAAA